MLGRGVVIDSRSLFDHPEESGFLPGSSRNDCADTTEIIHKVNLTLGGSAGAAVWRLSISARVSVNK